MSIFVTDDNDFEGGVEHALSVEPGERVSPVESRLRTFMKNSETLERAITENDIDTIENLKGQVEAYRSEAEMVRGLIAEIDSLIQKES